MTPLLAWKRLGEKERIIRLVFENGIAPVAAILDVVNRAILDSQLARHLGKMPTVVSFVNIKN